MITFDMFRPGFSSMMCPVISTKSSGRSMEVLYWRSSGERNGMSPKERTVL